MTSSRPRILLIEDTPAYIRMIQLLLAEATQTQFAVKHVARFAEALDVLVAQPVDAILLDLNLPDAAGVSNITRIHQAAPETPIIVLTSDEDQAKAIQALAEGAHDYLFKGEMTGPLLERVILYSIERMQTLIRLRGQRDFFEKLTVVAQTTTQGLALEDTLRNALSAAMAITNASRGSLFVFNEAGEVVRSVLLREFVSPRQQQAAIERIMSMGLAGWALRHQEIALITDTQHDERWLNLPDELYPARSALAVPILADMKPLGLLTLVHPQPNQFTTEHVQLMRAAALQMSLAIRNASLYEEQVQRVGALAHAQEMAEAAARAKGQFLLAMSRDLHVPLTTITAAAATLLKDITDERAEGVLEHLEHIQAAATQLYSMTGDLLEFARLDRGQSALTVEIFPVQSLVDDLAAQGQFLAQKNNNVFEVQAAAGLGQMETDRAKLSRALLNLMDNATRFTQRGRITLTVSRADPATPPAIQFRLADTGVGMLPEQIKNLSNPLHPTETRAQGGLGLGIYISRRLCQMLGGKVSIESELGHGTTIVMQVPTRPAASRVIY